MTAQEIKERYDAILSERGIGKKLGLSKFDVHNHRRREVSIGSMLEILWRAEKLTFK